MKLQQNNLVFILLTILYTGVNAQQSSTTGQSRNDVAGSQTVLTTGFVWPSGKHDSSNVFSGNPWISVGICLGIFALLTACVVMFVKNRAGKLKAQKQTAALKEVKIQSNSSTQPSTQPAEVTDNQVAEETPVSSPMASPQISPQLMGFSSGSSISSASPSESVECSPQLHQQLPRPYQQGDTEKGDGHTQLDMPIATAQP